MPGHHNNTRPAPAAMMRSSVNIKDGAEPGAPAAPGSGPAAAAVSCRNLDRDGRGAGPAAAAVGAGGPSGVTSACSPSGVTSAGGPSGAGGRSIGQDRVGSCQGRKNGNRATRGSRLPPRRRPRRSALPVAGCPAPSRWRPLGRVRCSCRGPETGCRSSRCRVLAAGGNPIAEATKGSAASISSPTSTRGRVGPPAGESLLAD